MNNYVDLPCEIQEPTAAEKTAVKKVVTVDQPETNAQHGQQESSSSSCGSNKDNSTSSSWGNNKQDRNKITPRFGKPASLDCIALLEWLDEKGLL